MKAWHAMISMFGLMMAIQLPAADMPKLTAYERSQGWRFLFDGQSLTDWRGYQLSKMPPNWQVVDYHLVGEEGRALVTTTYFKDFELVFDWKVSPGGNAAICFRAEDDTVSPVDAGPIMQLAGAGVLMAGNGGFNEPWRQITLQPDVWYRSKLVVYGNQVEHWINGDRLLSYLIDSPDWRTAVANSQFKSLRDYGLLQKGRIMLIGSGVMFHSIRIREL